MLREIEQLDTQRHASWKKKIRTRAANIFAGGLAIASIAGIGCKNIEAPNPIEPPFSTPAASEFNTPTSSQGFINRETSTKIDKLTNEQKKLIYSRLIDKTEASVDRRFEQYFLGFDDPNTKKGEDGRILLLREKILDKGGIPTWILITYDGARSLRVKNPNDIEAIETFINRGIEEAGKEEKYRRKNIDKGWVSVDPSENRITFAYGQNLTLLASFGFDSNRPPNHIVEQAIEKSKKRARDNDVRELREAFETQELSPKQPTPTP